MSGSKTDGQSVAAAISTERRRRRRRQADETQATPIKVAVITSLTLARPSGCEIPPFSPPRRRPRWWQLALRVLTFGNFSARSNKNKKKPPELPAGSDCPLGGLAERSSFTVRGERSNTKAIFVRGPTALMASPW